jgi:hypothetical protein
VADYAFMERDLEGNYSPRHSSRPTSPQHAKHSTEGTKTRVADMDGETVVGEREKRAAAGPGIGFTPNEDIAETDEGLEMMQRGRGEDRLPGPA